MSVQETLLRIESRLAALEDHLKSSSDEIMDVEGVHALTGLSRSAIYQKTCSREGNPPELVHFKQGKRLYFKRSDLITWLTSNRVRNRAELDAQATAYLDKRGGRP